MLVVVFVCGSLDFAFLDFIGSEGNVCGGVGRAETCCFKTSVPQVIFFIFK